MIPISYTVKLQTEEKYRAIAYGEGTIYSSACGPASVCNALNAAGMTDISIPTMCQLAVSCGARVAGGTLMAPLLDAAAGIYHFSYRTTSKNAELLSHLQSGGVAILHVGSEYPLFSTNGHFVTAAAVSGQTITLLDSYWYNGKYTASAIRRNYVSVVSKGIVKTSLTQCGKATIDRSPSYYLISRQMITDTSAKNEHAPEEDSMKYYKTLEDMPDYYQQAVKILLDKGAIAGTGDGLNLSDDLCRAFAILYKAGIISD